MEKYISFIGLAVLAAAFLNCETDKVKIKGAPSSNSNCTSSEGSVYVAVQAKSTKAPGVFRDRTFIWNSKDKTAKTLSNNSATVCAITVSGSDVYAAGSDGNIPVYWKNGVLNPLNDGSLPGEAKGIAVVDNEVHIVGCQLPSAAGSKKRAAYWKNGVCAFLPGELTKENCANGIALVGNDVHIVGGDEDKNPKYWVNGTHVELTDRKGELYAIAALGSNVYIVGYERHGHKLNNVETFITVAMLWENGKSSYLSDPLKLSAEATCLAVCEGNIYVGGTVTMVEGSAQTIVAVYWKNKAMTVLGKKNGNVYGIAISGNSFYVIGKETVEAKGTPAYGINRLWKGNNIEPPIADDDQGLNMQAIAAQ